MKKHTAKKGFTIVELSLSSAFLGILLITIALLVTHIITIYQKGMTLKAVNMVGEDLIDNLSRTISATPDVDLSYYCDSDTNGDGKDDSICTNDLGFKYLYQQRYINNVEIVNSGKIKDPVPASGAFCTGKYSYVWNTGYVLDDSAETYIVTNGKPGDPNSSLKNERARVSLGTGADRKTISDFHLLRIQDTEREICESGISNGTYSNPGKEYAVSSSDVEVTELLKKSEDNLALYDLTMFEPTYHANTGHAFYSGTFILATIRGGVNIMVDGDYCTDNNSGTLSADFSYCAMNKFNFAVRATGESQDE